MSSLAWLSCLLVYTLGTQRSEASPYETLDVDRNGRPDFFTLLHGERILVLGNEGDGQLVDRTAALGLDRVPRVARARWREVDGDGWIDLVVLTADGALLLYRNAGGHAFHGEPLFDQEGVVDWQWVSVDGAGEGDLLVQTRSAVHVLLGRGDGVYELASSVPVDLTAERPGVAGVASTRGADPSVEHADPPRGSSESLERPTAAEPGRRMPVATRTRVHGPAGPGAPASPRSVAGPETDVELHLACAQTLRDQSTGSCVSASSVPLLGSLYPLGVELFIDAAGRVGLGTTTPAQARLEVTPDPAGNGVYVETDVGGATALEAVSSSASDGFGIRVEARSPVGRAVRAENQATTGTALALDGVTRSVSGRAVSGIATAASGASTGVYGESFSPAGAGIQGVSSVGGGTGVHGVSSSASDGVGVRAEASSAVGRAVRGVNEAGSGNAIGVEGVSRSPSGRAVAGVATSAAGSATGVWGESAATDGTGVLGEATSTSGGAVGVWGTSRADQGTGVAGAGGLVGTSGFSLTGVGVRGEGGAGGVHGFVDLDVSLQGSGTSGSSKLAPGVVGWTEAPSQFGVGVLGVHDDADLAVQYLRSAVAGTSDVADAAGVAGWNTRSTLATTEQAGVIGAVGPNPRFAQGAPAAVFATADQGAHGVLARTIVSPAVVGINGNGSPVPSFAGGASAIIGYTDLDSGSGVVGQSTEGGGVLGIHLGSRPAPGVEGITGAADGAAGVYGRFGGSQPGIGAAAVRGEVTDPAASQAYGVHGVTAAPGPGVLGESTAATGGGVGVQGRAFGFGGVGVQGEATSVFGLAAVYAVGDLMATGIKSFVHPHPEDPSKEIRYAALEGNEAGTYFRGSARLVNGSATIEVPDDFRLVTSEEGLSVQLTAHGGPALLWVESMALDAIQVAGEPDVAFHFLVQGVRYGYEDLQTIHDNSGFVPRERGVPFGAQYPTRLRDVLVDNGTLRADYAPNEETAAELGWELRDPAPPMPARFAPPVPAASSPQVGGAGARAIRVPASRVRAVREHEER